MRIALAMLATVTPLRSSFFSPGYREAIHRCGPLLQIRGDASIRSIFGNANFPKLALP
jgi:hypothetical protein